MSGTIPLSMTQQFDVYGKPLAGGQLFLIQAGTVSTPQNGYQDAALTIPLPYPITLDAAGRIPQFFLADGSIKVRLQDKTGVVQLSADNILVIGPSAGGGGGSTVDPTTLIQMGNMIARYGIGPLAGYVRLNNQTIGSITSGATERANADCQALFQYLWGVDTSLVVSGGRGATAAADWAANKALTLPDWRGYGLGAMDDMGGGPVYRLTTTYFGADATKLGAAGGSQSHVLAISELPVLAPSFVGNAISLGTINLQADGANPLANVLTAIGSAAPGSGAASFNGVQATNPRIAIPSFTPSGTIIPFGGGGTMSIMGPQKLCTFYLKL